MCYYWGHVSLRFGFSESFRGSDDVKVGTSCAGVDKFGGCGDDIAHNYVVD